MRPAIVNRDPGDEQHSLFNSPAVCPDCFTTRRNLCRWEADRSEGQPLSRRPKGCLTAPQPSTDPIPY